MKRLSFLFFMAANYFLMETVVAVCNNPDTELPVLTCPPATTVTATKDGNQCSFARPGSVPSATDNCPGDLQATLTAGSVLAPGGNVVLFEVTDAAGNKASCSWNVFVDTTACGDLTTLTLNCGYFQDIPIIGWLLSLLLGWILCLVATLFGWA